ncbi:cilia- and flagella-associated protein 206 [Silurus meridionalis]|nr:cilia- and flagella-associated protein 206 [Silurus meridionalis]
MSQAQAESVIKKIIREIVQKCSLQGQDVSETLAAFMVKAVILDPKNLFNVDRPLTKDVEKLIEVRRALDTIKMQVHFDMNYTSRREFVEEHRKVSQMCLLSVCREITDSRAKSRDELDALYRAVVMYVLQSSSLGSTSDPNNIQEATALDTIKMQVHFDMNYTSRREFVEEHRKVSQMCLLSVCREITDSRAKSRDELDALYRAVVMYVLQSSSLGSTSDPNNIQEATAALQSVFPPSELAAFMSLLKQDKVQQLDELTMIVTGIRLFNKNRGKGGHSIEDLLAVLNQALPAASSDIEGELEGTQRLAWQYTSALLERRPVEDGDAKPDTDLLKQALYNSRQHEAFLKLILASSPSKDIQISRANSYASTADVITCAKQVEALQTDFLSRISVLKATVQAKTAVPASQVFPHFMEVARLWMGLQDEMVLLSMLRDVALSLRLFLTDHSQLLENTQLDQMLQGVTVKSDMERIAESSEERVDPSETESHEWILPKTTHNFEQLFLQYRGVCGYTLVEKNGLLLPGNPNIGVLKHREKYYSFSSKEAAHRFASNADEYIEQIYERAKRSPELILLLELHQEVRPGDRLVVKAVSKRESSTQTDTHLLECNIVQTYEWNEWELRRKAIKLANLRGKMSRSMQTDLSHMRRHNASQTFPSKHVACQTKKDGQSHVPKPVIYLSGLRGKGRLTTHMIKI